MHINNQIPMIMWFRNQNSRVILFKLQLFDVSYLDLLLLTVH